MEPGLPASPAAQPGPPVPPARRRAGAAQPGPVLRAALGAGLREHRGDLLRLPLPAGPPLVAAGHAAALLDHGEHAAGEITGRDDPGARAEAPARPAPAAGADDRAPRPARGRLGRRALLQRGDEPRPARRGAAEALRRVHPRDHPGRRQQQGPQPADHAATWRSTSRGCGPCSASRPTASAGRSPRG